MNPLDQRRAALAKANEIRVGKARVKRQLERCEVSFAEAIADPLCGAEPIYGLLRAVPTIGVVKARQIVAAVPIPPSKRVDALSVRQRAALLALVAPQQDLASYQPRGRYKQPAVAA